MLGKLTDLMHICDKISSVCGVLGWDIVIKARIIVVNIVRNAIRIISCEKVFYSKGVLEVLMNCMIRCGYCTIHKHML